MSVVDWAKRQELALLVGLEDVVDVREKVCSEGVGEGVTCALGAGAEGRGLGEDGGVCGAGLGAAVRPLVESRYGVATGSMASMQRNLWWKPMRLQRVGGIDPRALQYTWQR